MIQIIILVNSLISLVLGDVPVSCLRKHTHDQIWNFYVSQEPQTINLFENQEVCTHQMPNKIQVITKDHKWSFEKQDIWQVMIRSDYTAEAAFCKHGNITDCEKSVEGTWLNYYDQALHVEIPEKNLRFTANFRYNILPNITTNPTNDFKKVDSLLKKLDDSGVATKYQFQSQCDETMVGFVHQLDDVGSFDAHKISCFYASKDKAHLYEDQVALQLSQGKNSSVSNLAQQEDVSTQIPKKRGAVNLFAEHEASESTDAFIKHINDNDHIYTWKANTCMLQSSHRDYSCEQDDSQSKSNNLVQFVNDANKTSVNNLTANATANATAKEGQVTDSNATNNASNDAQNSKNFRKIQKKNQKSGNKAFGEKTPDFALAAENVQSWSKNYATIDDISDSAIPKSYDLRNIGGYDFTGNVRDQGPCGSCYTMSFIQAIESRLKYKYAHLGEIASKPLSPQFVLMGNYMSEGCSGGLAIFDGYLAEYGHLTTEECAPYQAVTKGDKFANYKNCPKYARINKSTYLRGYNFNPSVADIQKDILLYGAASTEFAAGDDFSFYAEGIMQQQQKKPEEFVQTEEQPLMIPSDGSIDFEIPAKKYMESPKGSQSTLSEIMKTAKMVHEGGVNHSVFLIGWGHDEKLNLPYWIVRNSYGDSWGMRGDFHVRMGHDDYGIESEITSFDVELLQN